jgi:hypothetical protein
MPHPIDGTLTRMAVVFRPLTSGPHAADTDEVFDDGEWIPDALIRTEHLPKGFPTAPFAPVLINHYYAIRVDIQVMPGRLLLSPRHQRGHRDVPAQPLGYGAFGHDGLPLSIPSYDRTSGVVAVPGTLHPLPVEPQTPRS